VAWEGPEEVKSLVAALERDSTHPLAAGFAAAWPGLAQPEASGVAHTIGGGVEGEVEGHRVAVGSPAFVRGRAREGRAGAQDGPVGGAPGDAALTPVLIAVDGEIVASAAFGDPVRADTATALTALRAQGWRPELLSGDDPRVVGAVGDALGFPAAACRGGAGPEDKLRFIEEAALEGPVVMVGDGVNDAAAISRATVGVGMHGGAEACLSSADVFLSRPGLAGLVTLTTGASRTLRVIRRNIVFSLAYNLVGASLAMTGVINPLIAAVLMPASSLTVILASWLSHTFEAARE